jgi:SRSO17 transposase
MDADTILKLKPALTQYLHQFDDCFGRVTARRHLDTYVLGQLGDLQRKSVEPIADAAGTPPRTLQEFLSLYRWDESAMRDVLQQRIANRHAHPHSVGILDETSFLKKGRKTACVQRQHCGAVGKTDNCVVSVHLGYATPEFHALLDGELYLPQTTWHDDRARCRAAGIPDSVVYRPKYQIGLEQLQRARANGIRLAWLTFDEGYGGKGPFLDALQELGQAYVGEVPSNLGLWTRRPEVLHRESARRLGRPRKMPRLKVKNNPPVTAAKIASHSPRMHKQPWGTYHVKDGHKGPHVWRARRLTVWRKGPDGLPGAPHSLLVAYNVLEPEKTKYFLSNAPQETPTETLLLVALSRWKVERMFEDGKSELGMNHFEVRQFGSIQRHLILSCVSYLFLAEFHQAHRGEKSGPDALPGAHGHAESGGGVGAWGPLLSDVRRADQPCAGADTGPQRPQRPLPPQANPGPAARARTVSERPTHVSVGTYVAL